MVEEHFRRLYENPNDLSRDAYKLGTATEEDGFKLTIEEINLAINKISIDTSPGPDGIVLRTIRRVRCSEAILAIGMIMSINSHLASSICVGALLRGFLSPTIFNLCQDLALKLLSDPSVAARYGFEVQPGLERIVALAFADDTAIIAKDLQSATCLVELLQTTLLQVGMTINSSKSVAINIQNGRLSEGCLTLSDGSSIRSVTADERIRYLGVNFANGIVFHKRKFLAELETFEDEFKNEGRSDDVMEPIFVQLDHYTKKLNELDRKMMDAILDDEKTTDEALDEEAEIVDEYQMIYLTCRNNFDSVKKDIDAAECRWSDASQEFGKEGSLGAGRRLRLPKLEPIKYDGGLKGWLQFWGQFRKIDEDPTIDDDDKMRLPLMYTVPNSKARRIIEKFPLLGNNYNIALRHLKSRCAKYECLVEVYVRELLQIVVKQASSSGDAMPLSDLYESLETQLRSLETIGVTTDKYVAMLHPMVESCLPVEILKAWGRCKCRREQEHDGEQRITDLEALMNFIKTEVDNEEWIQLAPWVHTGERKRQ
ncbi:hypothetical protein GE061_020136 [Apolygus lucorum]|uniref:Reverse transcriptase domain-containing protein n=1 Tax=Apolygus lucorum TaxID=248454 RepID=A0A8S9WJM9_APOLU|nr:hypothetical protein GE061_020136 [Apolygus lucorum]